jgi:tetratricopeptide (TPR) repeat protein
MSLTSRLREVRLLIDRNELTKALALLDESKRTDPRNVEVVYLRGYVLYRQGQFDPAKQELKAAIQLAPPGLRSRYFLGRIAQSEGQKAEAIRWLEPCAQADPSIEDSRSQISKLYWDTGQVQLAQVWTAKALAATPWDGSLHYRLARIYQQLGQPDAAKREFSESMQSKTADAEGVRKLMDCSRALASNDLQGAMQIRSDFLAASKLDPDLLVALGTAFAKGGAPDQAVELFETASQRDPQSFQAQFNLGLAKLNLKQPEAAVQPLQASLRLLPESKDANSALALAYVMQGKFSDSVAPLEAAREADSTDTKTLGLLSFAYYRTNAAAKAVPLLRQAIERSTDDPKLYFLLIDCLNETEKQSDALAVADAAVHRFPNLARAWLGKAQQLARLGRYHDAGPLFAKASELAPDQVEPLLGLAEAEQKDGNHESALKTYQQAFAKDKDVTAALGAAKSLIFLGRFAEARGLLEQSAAGNAGNSELHFELSRVYARLGERQLAEEQTRIVQQLRGQTQAGAQPPSASR